MRVCLARAAELCTMALEGLTCSCSHVRCGRSLTDRCILENGFKSMTCIAFTIHHRNFTILYIQVFPAYNLPKKKFCFLCNNFEKRGTVGHKNFYIWNFLGMCTLRNKVHWPGKNWSNCSCFTTCSFWEIYLWLPEVYSVTSSRLYYYTNFF